MSLSPKKQKEQTEKSDLDWNPGFTTVALHSYVILNKFLKSTEPQFFHQRAIVLPTSQTCKD